MIDFKLNDDGTGFEHGVYLTEDPAIPSAQREIVTTSVPGREHGSLTELGGWLDSKITLTLGAYSKTELKANLRAVVGWLYSAKEIAFNDDEKFFYKVKTITISDVTNQLGLFGSFTVDMVIDPFIYQRARTLESLTSSYEIYNLTTIESEPTFVLYGDGDVALTINGIDLTVKGVQKSIIIDSQRMMAYNPLNSVNLEENMIGEFPKLALGRNDISVTNATSFDLKPNWRWLT